MDGFHLEPGNLITMHDYVPCGLRTFGAGESNIHLVWCFNAVGHEAIGVAIVPANFPYDELKPTLDRSVRAAPVEKLFPCAGVLNREPLQATGPFSVEIGNEVREMYVVNGSFPQGHRAFLVLGASDLESALRPIWNFHQQLQKTKSKKHGGEHVMASDSIEFIGEFEGIDVGSLQPQNDFKFIRGK